MIKLHDLPVLWTGGAVREATPAMAAAREKTMACRILRAHNTGSGDGLLHLTFDSLISHDITYVGVIQTAKASGLTEFPVPYVLTNCHNSLCAVGGTINADDHAFGLSAAVKYGGDYVPANQAVIHQYAREMLAGCGKMVLGSDSHTRYGALGTLGVGEGGGEIVKQLLRNTYDLAAPQVVLVHVTGRPRHGVGPHDVAIALCGAVYKNGFVKNKVLEFVGDGIGRLSMDYRIGIDVMTTETACLTSIWETDGAVRDYLALHGRAGDYAPLHPEDGAYYDGLIELDLSAIEPMAALPFHPSEAVTLRELIADPGDILREVEKRAADQFGGKVQLHLTDKVKGGKLHVEQGVIAGCAGGLYDNIAEAAAILDGCDVGSGNFDFSVYPPSVPVELELVEKVFSLDTPGRDNQRKAVYRISHPLVRFWFCFLYADSSLLLRMTPLAYYEQLVEPALTIYCESCFSKVCQEYMQRENARHSLPIEITEFGSFAGKAGSIDYIGHNESGRYIVAFADYRDPVFLYEKYLQAKALTGQAGIRPDYMYLFSGHSFDAKLEALEKELDTLILIRMDDL